MRNRLLALSCLMVAAASGADYHLDCAQGSDASSGLSPSAAWRSPSHVNQQRLKPGDRLLLKRGVTCAGMLAPKGSGEPGRLISLGAYGQGGKPKVDARGFDAGLLLWNQAHWRVEDLVVSGSQVHGIFVGGDRGIIRDIELRDVAAQDVHGPLKSKNSGLIVVHATQDAVLENVTIDGARAERTTQWAGILINGASGLRPAGAPVSRRVTVRNSIVRDVWGDGIILFQVHEGIVERSAAWKTGMQPRQTIGTPNGIWTWRCVNCIVRECESFWSDSPGVDGGAFDIDWGNVNNTVERSYGHDTLSYCVAVFGAGKGVTVNSVIRNNVCAGLGRSPRLARHHGAIHLTTWDGGKLDGVRIEDNWIEWDPPIEAALIRDDAEWAGTGRAEVRNSEARRATRPAGTGGVLTFHLDNSQESRGLRVILESAQAQYAARGLRILTMQGTPCVEFSDVSGKLLQSWNGYAPAADVLWRVRQHLGAPSEW